MSMQGETSCPEAVLASIAWYPDALDERRRGMVEAHAASCAACREELAFVQGRIEPEIALPDADELYAGVLGRIERSESRARGARLSGSTERRPLRRRRVGRREAFGARPAMLAAGLALALLCGALGALGGMLLASGGVPFYETVAEPPQALAPAATGNETGSAVTPPAGPELEVVFRADARAEQVHAALRAIGAQIVSGPTQIGVYRIELPEAADVAAAARLLEGEGRGVAAFAQPVR
jgi:hypothetical protein